MAERDDNFSLNRLTRVAKLTVRELDVLALVAVGLSRQQIAESLKLSIHTVDKHVRSLKTKPGAPTLAGAVAAALNRRILVQNGTVYRHRQG